MKLFKKWFLESDLKDLRGQFNQLTNLRDYLSTLDLTLNRFNITAYLRESYKLSMLRRQVKKNKPYP